MTAKELIGILSVVDPDSEVRMTLGRDKVYREACAKAELATGECLGDFTIDRVCISKPEYDGSDEDDYPLWADITLKQDNLIELEECAGYFDEMYQKSDEYEEVQKRIGKWL
jgi:hypothetical protein